MLSLTNQSTRLRSSGYINIRWAHCMCVCIHKHTHTTPHTHTTHTLHPLPSLMTHTHTHTPQLPPMKRHMGGVVGSGSPSVC